MKYNGYICYNSKDYAKAYSLFQLLDASGVKLFFDKTEKNADETFDKIESGLKESQSMLFLVSANGLGPYQEKEVKVFHKYNTYDKSRKIFTICLEDFNIEILPHLLREYERYEYKDENDFNKEHLFKLSQALMTNEKINSSDHIERPILKYDYKKILASTVSWYHYNADMFCERWRSDLPIGTLEEFIKEVRKASPNPTVLDAGCGPGHHSAYLSKAGLSIIGIDLAVNALDIAKKSNIPNADFRLGDMRKLEAMFKSQRSYFDGIWAAGSCIHSSSESINWQLNQFLAYLKPKGILGITFQIGFKSNIDEGGRFFERYKDERKIEKKLTEVGFKVIKSSIDFEGGSTTKRKLKVWAAFIAQAPNEKHLVV